MGEKIRVNETQKIPSPLERYILSYGINRGSQECCRHLRHTYVPYFPHKQGWILDLTLFIDEPSPYTLSQKLNSYSSFIFSIQTPKKYSKHMRYNLRLLSQVSQSLVML